MRILLTGGAGFIGSHIAEEYIKRGDEVIIVDDLSTGKRENIPDRAEFHKVSILNRKKLEEIFKKEKIDIINHHAAQVSVSASIRNPQKNFQINVYGGINLLEMARKYKVPYFIFASSGGAIYGEKNSHPVKENANSEPVSPYGIAKKVFEEYLRLYNKLFGIKYVSMRYGNVYGPRQDPYGEGGVIAIFSHRMLVNKECIIYGDGKQERDFVYIEDAVLSNIKATQYLIRNRELKENPVFNIGTEKGTSINEIFKLLSSIVNYKKSPIYFPEKEGEIKKISLDCKKAEQDLKWKARTSLQEGLKKTVLWFYERIKKRNTD